MTAAGGIPAVRGVYFGGITERLEVAESGRTGSDDEHALEPVTSRFSRDDNTVRHHRGCPRRDEAAPNLR